MGFKSYKNRQVKVGQVVEVYRNLNNGLISLRDPVTRLVLGHAEGVTLTDATFRVSEAGRQRVLRENRKNVHAVIRGRLGFGSLIGKRLFDTGFRVLYNPRKFDAFMCDAGAGGMFRLESAAQVYVGIDEGALVDASMRIVGRP